MVRSRTAVAKRKVWMKRKNRPMKARTKCQGELENHEESGAYIYISWN